MLRHSWVPRESLLGEQLAFRRCRIYEMWQWTTGSASLPLGQLDSGLEMSFPEFGDVTLDPSAPYANGISPYSNHAASLMCGRGAHSNYGGVYSSPLWHSSAFAFTLSSYLFATTDVDLAGAITRARQAGCRIISVPRYLNGVNTQTYAACSAVSAAKGLVIGPVSYGSGMLGVGGTMPTDECASALTWLGEEVYFNSESLFGSSYKVTAPTVARGPLGLRNGGAYPHLQYDWATGDQGVAVAIVSIIAQAIVSVAPSLTTAQIVDCITSTVDKSYGGWLFSGYFTDASAGIANGEKAVLKALSLQNPTTVYPFLYIHGSGPAGPTDPMAREELDGGIRYTLDSQGWQVQAHGPIGLEVGAFKNGTALPVNVILDGQTVASNVLTSRALGNLVSLTTYRNDYYDVRVVEPVSGATRTFEADYASAPALNVTDYGPTIPGTLDSSNTDAATTATPSGTLGDLALDAGELAEWTVDAGAGGSFPIAGLMDSAAGAVGRLLIDGVEQSRYTVVP